MFGSDSRRSTSSLFTSGTFSVYDDDPRSDQIHNQDRNFRTYDIFCNLGVPCIPFLFFNPSSDLDYRNVINWLAKRRDVVKVAVLAHSFRDKPAFERMLTQTRSIASNAGRPLQFVFVGASTVDKIRLVLNEYSDASFVATQPVSKGRVFERVGLGLKSEKISPTDADKSKLIVGNIEQFDYEIDAERARYLPHELPYQELLPFQFQITGNGSNN